MSNPGQQSDHLRYRALEPDDLEWLVQMENDPGHWSTGSRQLPLSRDVLRRYLENTSDTLAEAGQFRWVIQLKNAGTPIGLIDLFDYNARDARASVGILIHPDHRRKGHAAEALNWLSEYGRGIALLHQLHAQIPAGNKPSIELFSRSGYRETGRLRDWLHRPSGWEDVLQMQLIL